MLRNGLAASRWSWWTRCSLADETRRRAGTAYDTLRAEQKALGRKVAQASGDEKAVLLADAQTLAADVRAAEAERDEADATAEQLLRALSNIVDPAAPVGGEDDYVVLAHVGTPRDFAAEGFEPRDHLELGELLGAIDTDRGAKVSGARFYYLTGVGALLQLGMLQLAIAQAVESGFTPVITPVLVKPEAMEGTGFLSQAAENVYHLADEDLYLVGTSEVPLAAYHMGEILDAAALPLRYAGWSSCFRREAGSYGKDTRGIIRVHQFDKVEMFCFVRPGRGRGGARATAGLGAADARRRWRSPIASSTWPRATSARARCASSTARAGCRRRVATAS